MTRVEESRWAEAPGRPGEHLCRRCHGNWKKSSVRCCDCWEETRDYVVAHDIGADVFVSVHNRTPE